MTPLTRSTMSILLLLTFVYYSTTLLLFVNIPFLFPLSFMGCFFILEFFLPNSQFLLIPAFFIFGSEIRKLSISTRWRYFREYHAPWFNLGCREIASTVSIKIWLLSDPFLYLSAWRCTFSDGYFTILILIYEYDMMVR